jgi:MSHA biogenesis protein MshI
MFAIAARNKIIEQMQHRCLGARWPLSVIDIPEMAQRNIAARLEPEGRGLAMLSFNADGGLLTISFRGELHLVRRIDIAPELLREPDLERRHASFDRITLELQRSLDHFDRQYHYISVAKLLLAPNDADGLESYLSSNLYTPVESFALDSVFELGAVPELAASAAQQRYFLALGAALRVEEVVL